MVYDHAANKLSGPEALTNFSTPTAVDNKAGSGYNTGEESPNTARSLKSVLRFVSTADSHAEAEPEAELSSAKGTTVSMKENNEDSPIFPPDDDLFSGFNNPVPVPDLFDQTGDIFGAGFYCSCGQMLIGSSRDFGLDIGLWPTWNADDYFQNFGDVFGSDPLVSVVENQ